MDSIGCKYQLDATQFGSNGLRVNKGEMIKLRIDQAVELETRVNELMKGVGKDLSKPGLSKVADMARGIQIHARKLAWNLKHDAGADDDQ